MLIDCDTCQAPRTACAECVMTVLLRTTTTTTTAATTTTAERSADPPAHRRARRSPADGVELDDAEHAALGTLARAGLVPPLRLVRATPEPPVETVRPPAGARRTRGIA